MNDPGRESAGSAAGVVEADNKALIERMHADLVERRDAGRVEDFFAHDFVSYSMPAPLTPGREGAPLHEGSRGGA